MKKAGDLGSPAFAASLQSGSKGESGFAFSIEARAGGGRAPRQ
jgi:hypothetical protein